MDAPKFLSFVHRSENVEFRRWLLHFQSHSGIRPLRRIDSGASVGAKLPVPGAFTPPAYADLPIDTRLERMLDICPLPGHLIASPKIIAHPNP